MADDTLSAETLKEKAEQMLEGEEDGTRFKTHSLKELIAMDRYLAARKAASNGGTGLYFFQQKPPGSSAI